MPDNISIIQRRKCMTNIHSTNTRPELMLRHKLWHYGLRYRTNDRRLPGKPDIVLPKYRTVIFVHGCFWHGHQGCKHFVIPKSNTEYWDNKIRRNQDRDQREWRSLEAKGWFVIIVWECELNKQTIDETVARILVTIHNNGALINNLKAARGKNREAYLKTQREKKDRANQALSEIKHHYKKA